MIEKSVDVIVRRETQISVVINAVLSAAFFGLAFGITPRTLAFGAPDKLGMDFIPQSLAIGFFAALVPALLISHKRRKGLVGGRDTNADPARTILLRAIGFAAIAGLAGALLAAFVPMGAAHIAYFPALGAKVAYGALLAAIITPRALRMVLAA